MKSDLPPIERASGFARMLAEPRRIRLLQAMMPGPLSVSELVALTGATQSNISNHLKALRDSGMVRTARLGRQVSYEVADSEIAHLVQVLTEVAGVPAEDTIPTAPLVAARTCHDHLAGRLGVALFAALEARGAIRSPCNPWAEVTYGPAASEVFEDCFGLDLAALPYAATRRRFAFACPDWTSESPHLGGALAAALLERLFSNGWIERRPDNARTVRLTELGATEMGWLFKADGAS